MTPFRFAALGCGFWADYQLAGWREVPGVECVGVYNRTKAKAERFGLPAYDDPERMIAELTPDFLDVITDVGTHRQFVELAAKYRVPVVCQKPMAETLADAEAMVEACRAAGVPLLVNENWRWQTPLRELHRVLQSGAIGTPFRARIDMISGFPVFANQPFLAHLERFILTDLGSHTLDVARLLFGEARSLYCTTRRTLPHIKGENVASVMLEMGPTTVLVQLAYAQNPLERECFPETLVFVEGDRGSLELCPGCVLKVTTTDGTLSRRVPPPQYPWANPAYAVVHSSIVPCQTDLARHLRGEGTAETTGEDNLNTVRLVFAAYDSVRDNRVVHFA
ncbi:MAG: Gfo/Idh/MocA family oxidoreductase [Gemmataceae bacterium]